MLFAMKETMGERLRRLRSERGLNQADVAEASGVGRPFLSTMESDKREGSFATLAALADFYGVSMDYLYRGRQLVPLLEASSDVVKDADERSLLRMWRAMNEAERRAIVGVAERLADRSDSHDAA